jgi:hypothetical protein
MNIAALLNKDHFNWNGIGVLRKSGEEIRIEKSSLLLEGLGSVPAHKIIREGAIHQMRVGDRETDSEVMTGELAPQSSKRSVLVITGWILLILSLIAIIYFFYKEGWQLKASGLKFN